MSQPPDASSLLAYALATWIFVLHVDGVHADDADIHQACTAVATTEDEVEGNEAGEQLVERVRSLLTGTQPNDVLELVTALYGDRVRTDLGAGDRGERTHRIRNYQFKRSLPWLARVWQRHEDGSVGPSWLVIERVTDLVFAMDPNPWNDIDEEQQLPVSDFHVLWELDGCTSIHVS